MDTHKLQVKLFATAPHGVRPREAVPVFHRWIQSRRLDELAIDVTDYSHVHHGPGALLVCDGANYNLDEGEGRLGLLYTRKRPAPGGVGERLRAAVTAALIAAAQLEQEPELAGRLRFAGDELLVRVNDRLFDNDAAGAAWLRGLLAELAALLYPGVVATFEAAAADPRARLGVRVRAPGASGVAALLARIGRP
jgi:hypothetical protein